MMPEAGEPDFRLAIEYHQAGRLAEAQRAYRQVLAQQPNHADALHLLGVLELQAGRLDAAVEFIWRPISICSTNAIYYSNLGKALKDKGQPDQAIAACQQAIRLKPDFAEAYINLGTALVDIGHFDEAIVSGRQAIRLKPEFAEAHGNLGSVLMRIGQLDEAIAFLRQAIRLKPDLAVAHSNLVCVLQYHPGYDAKMIHEELRRWNGQHAEPLKKLIQPHANNRDPDRRLRIGYVSADFRDHVVGQNLLPLLREHDHREMEIFCYSKLLQSDTLTDQLRSYADVWRSIMGLSDSQAADLIRQDGIDILVDLALHMADNRLAVFARKPAPYRRRTWAIAAARAWMRWTTGCPIHTWTPRIRTWRASPPPCLFTASGQSGCRKPIGVTAFPARLPSRRRRPRRRRDTSLSVA
ncbi:MAG: tetratricopeptide repeat protein [Tepidisphaeraceae bacterium]|jgi:predicted O-linked N-acetylglucosamine transferase (SPINDLY family)